MVEDKHRPGRGLRFDVKRTALALKTPVAGLAVRMSFSPRSNLLRKSTPVPAARGRLGVVLRRAAIRFQSEMLFPQIETFYAEIPLDRVYTSGLT
jgi:hypothetical protein